MSPDSSAEKDQLPAAWREAWRHELAEPLANDDATDSIALFVFRLGTEWFSLPAAAVVEVTPAPGIHRMPHRNRGIGVVNVRGRIVPYVDLSPLLNPAEKNSEPGDRLAVLEHDDWIFATLVDATDGVRKLELGAVQPPPPPGDAHRFTSGLWSLEDRSIARLDEIRLFAAAREALA
jgi:chemotaxis-related protein WspD